MSGNGIRVSKITNHLPDKTLATLFNSGQYVGKKLEFKFVTKIFLKNTTTVLKDDIGKAMI